MTRTVFALVVPILTGGAAAVAEDPPAKTGPLRPCPDNPRYFADGSGKAVFLTGAHTWNNLVDMGPTDPPARFDYAAYLDYLGRYGHNFIRMWTWESTKWNPKEAGRNASLNVFPHPWSRPGPGEARDGKPKFDLTKYNPEYFDRLRARVSEAGRRGIYASIMLFEGWGMQFAPGAWESHPFHPDNNVNGLNGDANGDGKGLEIHEMAVPAVTAVQEAYVRKVVDTVNDLDNVLYEISNENHPPSTEWQYHMIRFLHEYERTKPKQHPVGMTFQYKGGSNRTLFEGPADWISPNPEGGYRDQPPPADGRKVVLSDTDHLWGIGGSVAWVWKSFLRGHNVLFMDPYDGTVLGKRFEPKWEPILRSMGAALRYARRMDLAKARPQGELSSTTYCLAEPGKVYLAYLPGTDEIALDLSAAPGRFSLEGYDPATGETRSGDPVEGGKKLALKAPFPGAVLCLQKD